MKETRSLSEGGTFGPQTVTYLTNIPRNFSAKLQDKKPHSTVNVAHRFRYFPNLKEPFPNQHTITSVTTNHSSKIMKPLTELL